MFKTCTCCNHSWAARSDFLRDRGITIVGYQASFDDTRPGLFLFNHSCRTTLAIQAGLFADLSTGPIYPDTKTGGPECPGLCLREDELGPCPARCKFARIREVIQVIKNHEKS
ncbi:MAG TPA: hypothetical protein PLM53_01735 [Spirochaetota bacterium]|nr:hypothetical protein [Spirochaetota bacterium]HPC41134.1 hypothetical protein [Spirochaetota bacterium]HPL15556.1 hypothetical protein [Spirochaetota bacterium]HQF07054.1 hypothetical protein [Spirochaetota bacterium]HQH95791.1 hypothetical protein [Spirochaetota bacterium]